LLLSIKIDCLGRKLNFSGVLYLENSGIKIFFNDFSDFSSVLENNYIFAKYSPCFCALHALAP